MLRPGKEHISSKDWLRSAVSQWDTYQENVGKTSNDGNNYVASFPADAFV